MDLGLFSLSLCVKDLEASMAFYSTLGFQVIDGGHTNNDFPDTAKSKWRIIANESIKIGLFQGMFDENIITFHPEDVMAIQEKLKEQGIPLKQEISTKSGSVVVLDPDGNTIMFDQG